MRFMRGREGFPLDLCVCDRMYVRVCGAAWYRYQRRELDVIILNIHACRHAHFKFYIQ